jgi:hypothetical protein
VSQYCSHRTGNILVIGRGPLTLGHRERLAHVPSACQLHLHGMYAFSGVAVMARGVPAAESAIGHAGKSRLIAGGFDRGRQRGRTGCTVVGPDVEVRQRALEQPRNLRSDRMAVIQHDFVVFASQPGDRRGNCRMVGIEKRGAAHCQLRTLGLKAGPVQRLAVKGRCGTQLGGRLSGIQRHAGRVPVTVNDRARDAGPDDGRTHRMCEVVEQVDPPVRILACEPWRNEAVLNIARNVHPGVGHREDERRIAARNGEPG